MRLVLRGGLVILALSELAIGVWQQFLPASFYRDFPTVQLMPPYNEHLVRDIGGGSIGLAIVLAAAAFFLDRRLVTVALIAYLAWAVPHLVFHLSHLHDASTSETAFLVLSLGGSVVVPAVLLAITPRALRAAPPAE